GLRHARHRLGRRRHQVQRRRQRHGLSRSAERSRHARRQARRALRRRGAAQAARAPSGRARAPLHVVRRRPLRRDALRARRGRHAAGRSRHGGGRMTAARFDGRLVFVTGGGSGLGAATCNLLADSGATVAVCDRAGDRAERVAAEIESGGGRAFPVELDIGVATAAERALPDAASRHGGLFALVNSAGVDFTLPVDELSIAQWDAVMATNLRGPFVLSRCAASLMKPQGGGHIVNITSTAAKRTWPNASAYHASKWGLLGFSHALHAELRPFGIKVCALVAGGMATPFLLDRFPDIDVATLQDPKNVAATVAHVLSQPQGTAIAEGIVLPVRRTSWP